MKLDKAIRICEKINDVSEISDEEKREAIDSILDFVNLSDLGSMTCIQNHVLLNALLWLSLRQAGR